MATGVKPVKHRDGTIKWRVRFRTRKGANPVSETFDSHDEASRFAQLVDKVGGEAARKVRNVADLSFKTCDEAFEIYAAKSAGRVTPETVDKYRRIWARHISDEFGAWPVGAVTGEHVELWIANLRKTELVTSTSRRRRAEQKGLPAPPPAFLSGKSIANVHGLLSSVLESEVRAGRLDRNVAKGIDLPTTGKTRQPVFLTTGEFARLLHEIPNKWQPLVSLIAATGLRWGEATALTPGHFDLESGAPVVRVSQAWQRGARGEPFSIQTPKTPSSVRTVSLPASVLPAVYEVIDGVDRDGQIFEGPNGRLHSEWFYEQVWNHAVARAGLGKRPRAHDLRHSHASWLIFQGVPLTVSQRRLGHSSIKVTSDVYGHLAPESWERAAHAADLALSQALPQIGA